MTKTSNQPRDNGINQTKQLLINALASGDFVSGQQMAEQCQLSRSAIAKHINSLAEVGLDIYRVSGKGYKLSTPLDLLNRDKINQYLPDSRQHSVDVHTIIESTNDYLLGQVRQQITPNQVCLAEYQSAGRGRRGRQWISPFASNIYLSMYWHLEQGMSEAMGLNIVSALAISDAINELYQLDVQLKWPNDVYINGKKLAGILIDLEGQPLEDCHCVIGIGVNVAMPESQAQQIDQPWADLSSSVASNINRNQLAATLIKRLSTRLQQHKEQGLETMLEAWHQRDMYLDQEVKIITGSKETIGISRGINQQGALLLLQGQKVTPIYGGEVSLRGLNATAN
ncbi:bifunctional biotin--[acetyl-CoA-carboxylase] ligase/biotin operon repressor BirA [Endozoicomonas sp. G2_1]|uniref:bifunctional biotin--[acetyl-CoA-carboxylase] ligase/biotin operon repressor BirA n=1 Tax=Endozoicomonas sp. G2_1 TaxID=2821091 RepID=UPI001ADC6258|nr:bifunctional biotin--[acetyl-CoA-carboxylase] ligase/biotin operon repressor BirA [Endozoicomonas sp. G2_1]MBO9492458.1 bifunctional biotin--[acetyl-CoA-carboxylase] ligase/biotin operon repressor BirA [Endozoicomonas sp. G2_1]